MMTIIMVMIILTVLLKTMMSVINIENERGFLVSNDVESSLEAGKQNCSYNGFGENDKDEKGVNHSFQKCGLGQMKKTVHIMKTLLTFSP